MAPSFFKRMIIGLLAVAGCIWAGQSYGHGDVHERIVLLSAAIYVNPDSSGLYLRRGLLHQRHGDFKKAKTDYLHYCQMEPDSAFVLLKLGQLCSEHDATDSGLIFIQAFLQTHENHVLGLRTRALLLRQSGDFEGALRDYKKVLALAAQPLPENFLEPAQAALAADSQKVEAAVGWLWRGVRQLGFVITFYEKIIEWEMAAQNYSSALACVDTIISRLPRHEKWLVKKAEILARAGQLEAAVHTYQQAEEAIRHLPEHVRQTDFVQALAQEINVKQAALEARLQP